MDLKMTARLLAVTALALAVAATIVARHKENYRDRPTLRSQPVGGSGERLSRELARCRTLGEAATHSVACKAAWEENRRRFFMPADRDKPAWPADDRFGNVGRSIGEPAAP